MPVVDKNVYDNEERESLSVDDNVKQPSSSLSIPSHAITTNGHHSTAHFLDESVVSQNSSRSIAEANSHRFSSDVENSARISNFGEPPDSEANDSAEASSSSLSHLDRVKFQPRPRPKGAAQYGSSGGVAKRKDEHPRIRTEHATLLDFGVSLGLGRGSGAPRYFQAASFFRSSVGKVRTEHPN